MTLPASGAISLSQVNVELGLSATAQIGLGDTNVRTLAGVPSGAISLDNLHGKSNVTPGSQTFTIDGTFVVPNYSNLTVTVRGAGGGGGGGGTYTPYASEQQPYPVYYRGATGGGAGSASFQSSTPMYAYGGSGGQGGAQTAGSNGAGGAATGGSTNTTGGGSAGGTGGYAGYGSGGVGGAGGYSYRVFAVGVAGSPAVGASILVYTGYPGYGGSPGGGAGSGGFVTISWS